MLISIVSHQDLLQSAPLNTTGIFTTKVTTAAALGPTASAAHNITNIAALSLIITAAGVTTTDTSFTTSVLVSTAGVDIATTTAAVVTTAAVLTASTATAPVTATPASVTILLHHLPQYSLSTNTNTHT